MSLALAWGCTRPVTPQTPREALRLYASALEQGKLREAYDLLSEDAKRGISFQDFQRMVQENPQEVRELARALSRPSGPPLVTATVSAPNGETLLLVYQDDAWKVDASAIDLYSQATPRASIQSFVRAFENKRYDVLMRFVPESKKDGLSAQQLKQAWEGEQQKEMDSLVQALKAALPSAKIELLGDRATVAYGAGGTVELLNEHGVWKVEELK